MPMGLSGLEIYKLLPKTNCRKCGFPTCLAFAMALAKKQVDLSKCPDITEQIREKLQEASLPPIRLVKIGPTDNPINIGKETVMFRHEEKFYHPTAIGFIIDDDIGDIELKNKLLEIRKLTFERVGQVIKPDLIAVRQKKDVANLIAKLKIIFEFSNLGLVLIAKDAVSVKKALQLYADKRPLVYCANQNSIEEIADLAKEFKIAVVVNSTDIEGLQSLVQKVLAKGLSDIVLSIEPSSIAKKIEDFTFLRRLALKQNKREFGFPLLSIVENKDVFIQLLEAGVGIAKYASIVLIDNIESWQILALLTLRQNIYTDPQKPLQVEPKVYSVGQTSSNSPVLVTTNFSLTYYTVLGEVEASRIPSFIISVDTEGMSVLTAWAAEKFTPESISVTLDKLKVKDLVSHNRLIIPGYVAVMSGELEEKSGWNVLVGPKEASGIPSFLKKI